MTKNLFRIPRPFEENSLQVHQNKFDPFLILTILVYRYKKNMKFQISHSVGFFF